MKKKSEQEREFLERIRKFRIELEEANQEIAEIRAMFIPDRDHAFGLTDESIAEVRARKGGGI